MTNVARTPPTTPILGVSVALALLAGVSTCLWLPWLAPWWLSLASPVVGAVCLVDPDVSRAPLVVCRAVAACGQGAAAGCAPVRLRTGGVAMPPIRSPCSFRPSWRSRRP